VNEVLRVIIYGDESVGSGGWFYARALRAYGAKVAQMSDWEGLERYRHSFFGRAFRRLTGEVIGSDRQRHAQHLVEECRQLRPHLVLVLKGLHIAKVEVEEMKRAGAWVVNLNHDDFFSKYRLNWSRTQRDAIPAYHQVLTTRTINVEEVRPLNSHVEFFPFAYDPEFHRVVGIPEEERKVWDVDVSFVGTYAPHRAMMLEGLVRQLPARYAIYGANWHKLSPWSPLRPFVRGRCVVLEDFAKAIGGAKVALGFLRRENRDDYTQRSFEIPACGGCLLAERTSRHQQMYLEGEEAEFFDANSGDELVAKTKRLLAEDSYRERIVAGGLSAVARGMNTYADRMKLLLKMFRARNNVS
jgi:spore maturation protein CgeB